MPNIREYSAPSGKINPDEKGYAAFETAGRRIGPLYNQAAQDVEKGGKLQDQLISQLERETDLDAAPEVLRGNNGGSSRGGGGALGRGSGRGLMDFGGEPPQVSGTGSYNGFIDPLDAANAAKWAASTARKLTGSPGNGAGGSIDELEWEKSHGGLTQDQQQRYQMLSDIQTKKDNAAMDLYQQKQLDEYKAGRDKAAADYSKVPEQYLATPSGRPTSSGTGDGGTFSSAPPPSTGISIPGLDTVGAIFQAAYNGITTDSSGQPSAQAVVNATVDAEQTGAEQ